MKGAALALVLAAIAACTGKPPEIAQIDLKPIYVRDPSTGAIEARLRLYLQASDPDGAADLLSVYLIHDGKEVFWELRNGEWQNGGNGWIGTYSLRLPPGWAVPGGTYRVVVVDAAGESVTREARIDPPAVADLRFPGARGGPGVPTVDPPGAWIWAYSATGELTAAAAPAAVSWDRVATYFVYSVDPVRRVGLLSGPYTR
jgi:hypothetical protein